MGRFDESKDRGIVLGTSGVARDGAARWSELGDVVPRQVRADGLPTGALVRGAKDDVAGGIEHVRVVRGKDNGIRPLEAVFEIPGAPATVGLGPDRDNAHLPAAVIIAQQHPATARRTADGPGVDSIGIVGMYSNVAAFRAPYGIAVAPENGPFVGTAGDADGAIVLLCAIDAIGELVVGCDMIKLRRGLVVNRRPCSPRR